MGGDPKVSGALVCVWEGAGRTVRTGVQMALHMPSVPCVGHGMIIPAPTQKWKEGPGRDSQRLARTDPRLFLWNRGLTWPPVMAEADLCCFI